MTSTIAYMRSASAMPLGKNHELSLQGGCPHSGQKPVSQRICDAKFQAASREIYDIVTQRPRSVCPASSAGILGK